MDRLLLFAGFCGLAPALVLLVRTRNHLKQTTLIHAWTWTLAAGTLWICAWLAHAPDLAIDRGLADRLWYAAAILALCPAISVLGARRPTTRVWQWFVVLPMIVVLALPLASSWRNTAELPPLQLETPVLAGAALVLVMSAGNYVGTRFTLAAALWTLAVALNLATVAEAVPDTLAEHYRLRFCAVIALSLAPFAASRRRSIPAAQSAQPAQSDFDRRIAGANRLWTDFRNAFGIVWARRIQERVNAAAAAENWPARLELTGFIWTGHPDSADDPAQVLSAAARIEHTLRWLLRRFCDPPWIEDRMAHPPSTNEPK